MRLESLGYPVLLDHTLDSLQDFLQQQSYSKIFILVDGNTKKYCLPIFLQKIAVAYHLIQIDAGETHKNIETSLLIWRQLATLGADRKSLLINLGGGVVTDIGGFTAATFKRGIDFIQIPTTLLSQVDASVGGKTGVDLDHVKNLIGTFTQPKAVFVNPNFLLTLPVQQCYSGFAEMLKHGLIYDEDYFKQLSNLKPEAIDAALIFRSIQIKNAVVLEDPTENNLRKILNFGHTIGHAIESYSLQNDSQPLLHGEAIAIGMVCEAWLSTKRAGLNHSDLKIIKHILQKYFPYHPISPACFPDLIALMQSDKKNQNNKIGFSLLKSVGKCVYNLYLDVEDILESLAYYNKLEAKR